ncbi:hypothetical protein D5F01_LYC18508 [Larimichthys crocea]|uniref:Uncharacterized protein n=1 Tax=Larimichthys crocea TaxID=215358 RepID=A0A6G0HV15_LARCR|nr:hypothetical protein D5F01_LYC18508 [Larimichthys crocea]
MLLHWFANTVDIDSNSVIWLTFDPNRRDYGSHHYGNFEELLDPLPWGYRYYTVGNLYEVTSEQLPLHVRNPPSEYVGRNMDRIIFRVQEQNTGQEALQRIDRVYITQHYATSEHQGTSYDPDHTYQITTRLLRQIREFSVREEQRPLLYLRNRYGRNIDDFQFNDIRQTWSNLACLGLLLFIVLQEKYSSNQRHNRRPEDNVRRPEHNDRRPEHNVRRPEHNVRRPEHNDRRPEHNVRRPENNQWDINNRLKINNRPENNNTREINIRLEDDIELDDEDVRRSLELLCSSVACPDLRVSCTKAQINQWFEENQLWTSVPKHSLVLLHWFANTVEIDSDNDIWLNFDPNCEDYGLHHYRNDERMLNQLPRGDRYYTIGNLLEDTSEQLPAYVRNPPTVPKLKSINGLKDIDFGSSVPKHSLVLLHWFANTVEIDSDNVIWLTFDPNRGDYGSHHYGNYEGMLDPLPRGSEYYTVGNLYEDTHEELPSYVLDPPTEMMKMSGGVLSCCVALLLALTSVSAVQKLYSIDDLKSSLLLLHWFANTVEINTNDVYLNFDLSHGDYGSHYYGNYEELLDPLPWRYRYYTIGNVYTDTSRQFPSYVRNAQEGNSDRIIIRVQEQNGALRRVDQVFGMYHLPAAYAWILLNQ